MDIEQRGDFKAAPTIPLLPYAYTGPEPLTRKTEYKLQYGPRREGLLIDF